jgi:5-methylcytosine-specific restriction endonuclease McrA
MRTLLLTPWYFPHKILKWQDAVTMIFKGSVDVVVEYNEEIRSPSTVIMAPAVLRLRRPIGAMKRGVKFSRVNIYTRDKFRCQYCGEKFKMKNLSYDHVTPRRAGGQTIWTNIVTACKPCNNMKADRTCDESGLWPLTKPVRPNSLPLIGPTFNIKNMPEEWSGFCSGVLDIG